MINSEEMIKDLENGFVILFVEKVKIELVKPALHNQIYQKVQR